MIKNVLFCLVLWSDLGSLAAQTVQIVSPADGTIFHPGQVISMSVEVSATTWQSVGVSAGELGTAQPLTSPPYRFQLQVPSDAAPGSYGLGAVGVDQDGQLVIAEDVTIAVERPDSPRRLVTDLGTLDFDHPGESLGITVDGIFPDGSKVNLTRSTLTTYSSDNPAVVTITPHAFVSAVGPGSANITITNSGVSLQIPVTVPPPVVISSGAGPLYPSQTRRSYANVTTSADADQSVTWSISPQIGSIDASGTYTAPASVESQQCITITATSVADNTKSGSIETCIRPPMQVQIVPAAVPLNAGQSQEFAANVQNAEFTEVTWSISPPELGSIDWTGRYRAPDTVASAQTVTVTATSVSDPSVAGTAHVNLRPSSAITSEPATTLQPKRTSGVRRQRQPK